MDINYYNECCDRPCRPSIKITDTGSMSTIQKLCHVLEVLEEVVEAVNGFGDELDQKEDSINITLNRLLSEIGDFTGTWFGETKSSIDQKIVNGQALYQEVIDLIESNPELGIEIIDGGFIVTDEVPEEIDAGLITDPPTEEIDAGYLIPPCVCN